jgi:hypothetical protein
LGDADGVDRDAGRRQVVATAVAELQLDGYGGSTVYGLGRVVKRADAVEVLGCGICRLSSQVKSGQRMWPGT